MKRIFLSLLQASALAGISLSSLKAYAVTNVADFESGTLPSGWTTSGSGWTVGGTTGTSPNIVPKQGQLFARSGGPNVASGPLAESLIGTLTSAPLTVSDSSIQWFATGWSGSTPNGINHFEILDANFSVLASVAAPQSDSWQLQSVNLLASGLSLGSTFYFRAIDQLSGDHYAWLAVDDITQAPVPEPSTVLLFLGGAFALTLQKSRSILSIHRT
jgi:hypothetical protein